MLVAGIVFALLAAAFHVYVFVLESVRWMAPSTRRTFRIRTDEEAAHTRPLALNQGFYNLFLAVIATVGAALLIAGATVVGGALVISACGSMVLAGLVLVISNPKMLRAALLQAVPPLIAVVEIIICLARTA